MKESRRYLLSIDIGTSGGKAAVFSTDGSLLSIAQHAYQFESPQPDWSELDPNRVWDCVCKAVQDCVSARGVDGKSIIAIGLSTLGETGLAVNEKGNAVYPIIESMDKRERAYSKYVDWYDRRFGREAIYQKTSYPLSSLPPVHKMLWIKDHRPDVFSQMAQYVSLQEYFVWRMTGKPTVDYSMASRTMLFDVTKKQWITEYLSEAGLSVSLLSEAVPSNQVVGELRESAAASLKLPAGIPVVPGAHDQSCAALGVGVVRPGLAGDGTGSVEAIAAASSSPLTSSDTLSAGIGSQCHVTPDAYLALGFHLTAGSLVRWYRDQLSWWEKEEAQRTGLDAYDLLTQQASASPPGANGLLVLPHWSGAGTGRNPPLNPLSRGAIFGLTLTHTKEDLVRAVFEGITYECRFLVESLESAGIPIQLLAVTGGGAKSPFWLQLKANITGKPIIVPKVTEASLLGAAILAGVGVGIYSGVTDAVEEVCKVVGAYEPDLTLKAMYDQAYAIYQDLYACTLPVHERLAV